MWSILLGSIRIACIPKTRAFAPSSRLPSLHGNVHGFLVLLPRRVRDLLRQLQRVGAGFSVPGVLAVAAEWVKVARPPKKGELEVNDIGTRVTVEPTI